jgi:uncharacterized SAM-binding protein YcdF (DUF218 family)
LLGWGLFCTPAVAHLAAGLLEWRYPPLDRRPADADAIVVFGGGVLWPAPDAHKLELTDSTLRRCYRAVELYRQGPPCLVIVVGGVAHPDRPGGPEGDAMRRCMVTMGVLPGDILVEDASRNTYENAVKAQQLLAARNLHRPLLVTDATHMYRSVRCFEKQGVSVIPAAAYYNAAYFRPTIYAFVPRAEAAAISQDVFHEFLGLAWYWWRERM